MNERRLTGFKDKHGVEIREGDLVVTRERMPQFRALAVFLSYNAPEHLTDWHEWFGAYGREHGRAWLGVVVEDTAVRIDGEVAKDGPYWAFRSANMGATIWDYWASDLEVVALPQEAVSFILEDVL
jgi:hypothetical protein